MKHGNIDPNGIWYHQNCNIFVNNKKNKCEWCERLLNILRAKKYYNELCLKKQSKKQLYLYVSYTFEKKDIAQYK